MTIKRKRPTTRNANPPVAKVTPPRDQGAVGRPDHKPTTAIRDKVKHMTVAGVTPADIARVLHLGEETLRKHYRLELDRGASPIDYKFAASMFAITSSQNANKAVVAARAYWLKSRAGRQETQKDDQDPKGMSGILELAYGKLARAVDDDTD